MPSELILLTGEEIIVKSGTIEANLADIKTAVAALKEAYTGWVVKEEDLVAAKNTITAINKTSKALSDKRIEVAKTYKVPLDAFEVEIKKFCTDLDLLSASIKRQTEEFDERTRVEKRKTIESLPEYKPYIIFNLAWLLKGASLETIINDIKVQTLNFNGDCQAIQTMCDAVSIGSEKYLKLREQNTAIFDITRTIANDTAVIAAANARKAALENGGAEIPIRPTTPIIPQPMPTPKPQPQNDFGGDLDNSMSTRKYTIVGRAYQLDALERYIAVTMGLQLIKQ